MLSLIPRDGIWVCIFVPIVLFILFVWALRVFNIQLVPEHMRLPPPKKKADFYTILGQAAKKYSRTNEDE